MATVDFNKNTNFHSKKTKTFYFKKKKAPLVLTFDENDRKEFLTGFRKRKLQRKKKAQEELEFQLKAEKKRVRQEAKDALKSLVLTNRDIPELEQLHEEADIVDMDTHEVQVTELDPARLARENNWIGTNKVRYEEERAQESDDEKELIDPNIVEGMEIKGRTQKQEKKKDANNLPKSIKTRKDVKKYVKQIATKTMKSSKIFQKKVNIEKVKNRKKKLQLERKREKNMKKVKSKRDKHRGKDAH